MLDLDILLERISAVTPLPLSRRSGLLASHYARRIQAGPGQAGYYITDEFLFCGKVVYRDTGEEIVVGPVSEHPLTAEICSRIRRELGPENSPRALQQELDEVPRMTLKVFLQHLELLNYILNQNSETLHFDRREISAPVPPRVLEPVPHNTEEFEVYFTRCIEHGRVDLLTPLLEETALRGMVMGDVSPDPIRALQNIFLSTQALASRAAVRGGLSYDLALTLSDMYQRRMEEITSYDSFRTLWRTMVLDMAERTAQLRYQGSDSPLVRQTVRRVSGSLGRKLTVEELARELEVSPTYLSHHFRRETGTSLTDYIAGQKISEARRLIATTELSLAQIAYQLGFSSQSYFSAIFRKVTGVSPGQYRRSGCKRP